MTKPVKILFLDIDGVVLPNRAAYLSNQTRDPFWTVFDPSAVGMLNEACSRNNWKIVLHSSWIRTAHLDKFHGGDVVGHCINQGINANNFYHEPYCDRDIRYRYDRITEYLARHPEIAQYVIVDDDPLDRDNGHLSGNFILTNPDEGLTVKILNKLSTGSFPRGTDYEQDLGL